jgi:FMN-dependent NADH-azoreductase
MSKQLLLIIAHPLDHTVSNSQTIAKEFIKKYSEINPQDKITTINLYEQYIPLIDKDVLSAWGALQKGTQFSELSKDQQQKLSRMNEILDQFLAANKYIFVSPMWNFSMPPMLKAYIDNITIVGKTFKYTETGPVGLLTDKKVLHIEARGGVYSEGPMQDFEMSDRYLHKLFTGFLGVPSFERIIIEGMAQFPAEASNIKSQAIAKAHKLAETF